MASKQSTSPLNIAIVGGGIGGIAVALSLDAQGVPFHIYESARSFGEIGAGVTFGPNVIRAIHGISPAMLRAYAKHVTTNESPDMRDVFLTYRKGYSDEQQESEHEGNRSHAVPEKLFDLIGPVQDIDGMKFPARCSVHRAHLLDELVRLLPEGSASFGKTLVGIRDDDDDDDDDENEVVLTFADGSTATATAVIGCDGIKSVVRRHLHGPDATAEYSGFFGYRAMTPRAAFERALGAELAATGNVFLCPNGYTIAYPVDHGAALNMFATCVQPDSAWTDKEWKVASSADELLTDLRGWHPGVLEMLRSHGNGEKWAMFHSPHDRPYYGGRTCLLGDAAHATTPHLGAGAGMAIEDAFVLGRLLGGVRDAAGVRRAFVAYDSVRRPRTQSVVRASKGNVATFTAASRAEGGELERLRGEAQANFGMVFDVDLGRHLADAMAVVTDDGLV